jgi:glycosyltransferase involved in cell wall biosynthesis
MTDVAIGCRDDDPLRPRAAAHGPSPPVRYHPPVAGSTPPESPGKIAPLRVLRISHSAVVTAWRQRERELRRSGVELTLLSAAAWDEGGSRVGFAADGDDFASPVATVGRHPNLFLYDPRPLWRALGSDDWDVLDLHEEPFGTAVAEVLLIRWLRRRRIPFVVYSAQNLDKRYPPPFRWFERWSLRRAAGAYTCNAEAACILESKGLTGPAAVIPLGVDVARFAPSDRRPPEGALRVGFVGRLIPHKGVDVLLRAAALDPRIELEIVGSGPEADHLVALARELAISERVAFRGHVTEEDLPALYRSFDALAVPSVPTPGWVEQFGRVVVEAQASGVPVVASRSGALPEVVDGAGTLADPGDPHDLARGLVRLLDEPGSWTEDRTAGLRAAERCSWARVAADQLALYRSATAARL